ncbi:MAG: TonB-dependent receptor [Chitinophagaceae bacterium]|nr:MAG: TonB-dependent receptor [Chitinophagaceae bacterium]
MKHLLLSAGLLACATISFAQTTGKGRVIDNDTQEPLAGANVLVNGVRLTTDAKGYFTYDCKPGSRFSATFVGYAPNETMLYTCAEDVTLGLVRNDGLLNQVEITATSAQNKNLLYQPSSITKLAPQQLQRSTGLFLDDAINANVPGVQMQRRAVSSGQTINIRGYGNGTRGGNGVSSNFDIQGVKVYLNGIPVTDAENITVLDDIDFGSIGSVEVVKGPAGSLYGLAIAGAVNLRTVRPEAGKTSVGQQVLLGSNGLERYTTTFQHGTQRSSILLNYGHQESKGFMPHNASRKDFVNFVGEFNPGEKQGMSVYAGFSNSYDQRAGELTLGQYDTFNFTGNPAYIKNDAHSHVLSARLGFTHTYTFSKNLNNTTTLFGSGVMNDASSAGGWTDKAPVNFGLRSTFQTRFSLGRNVTLTGLSGVESLNQRAQTLGYPMVADSANLAGYNRIGAIRSNVVTKTGNNSLFSEWTLALPKDWSFTAGLGWSQMLIELNDRQFNVANNRPNNRPADVFRKNYSGLWAPHVAVNKVIAGKYSVFASYSTGYKAPVSSYFYIPFVSGTVGTGEVNANLEPEKGQQVEVGTKGSLLRGRLQYELTYFHSDFRNKMTTNAVPGPNAATSYTYVTNGGNQVQDGLEAAVRVNAVQNISGFFTQVAPFANVTWSDGRYKDFQFERFRVAPNNNKDSIIDWSGKRVAGLPPVTCNVGVDVVTRPGIYANIYYTHRDAVYLTSDNLESQQAAAFGLLNAKLGFRRSFGRHLSMDAWAGGSNLTDEKHYIMVFINQLPDAYVPGALDAQWFGSISLKYHF